MTKSIRVQIGSLTSQLVVSSIKEGTTLVDFLTNKDIDYDSSVRVNGKVSKKGCVLKNGDIITIIDDVSGG